MEKSVIHKFCEKIKDYSFSINYWDGSSENYGQGAPAFKVIFKDKKSKPKKSYKEIFTKNNSNISDDSQDYDTVADLINKLLVHQNELEQEIKDLEDKIESLRYRL